MNRVDLAKVMGLVAIEDVQLPDLELILKEQRTIFVHYTCNIRVAVTYYDVFVSLDISQEDLWEAGDIKACIKFVQDLADKRAADEYFNKLNSLIEKEE